MDVVSCSSLELLVCLGCRRIRRRSVWAKESQEICSPGQEQKNSYANIAPKHGIPFAYRHRASVSYGVTSGCYMSDVGDPKRYEIISNNG